jgi:hypothetical protein
MFDLQPDQQDALLKEAWKEPYSFLFIAINAPRDRKYFIKFDRVEIWKKYTTENYCGCFRKMCLLKYVLHTILLQIRHCTFSTFGGFLSTPQYSRCVAR